MESKFMEGTLFLQTTLIHGKEAKRAQGLPRAGREEGEWGGLIGRAPGEMGGLRLCSGFWGWPFGRVLRLGQRKCVLGEAGKNKRGGSARLKRFRFVSGDHCLGTARNLFLELFFIFLLYDFDF